MKASRRWLIAVVCVALAVAAAGCSPNDSQKQAAPPIEVLFSGDQHRFDKLPAGAAALLSVVPSSSRYVGNVGAHHFYLAHGVAAPYCVVVADVYGSQVFHRCGGQSFGGEFVAGLRFEFGAFSSKRVESARGSYGLREYLDVEFGAGSPSDYPALVELLDRAQVAEDLALSLRDDGFYLVDSIRLIASDGDRRYFFALSRWPGMEICLIERSVNTQSGTCGWGDIVHQAEYDSMTFFSADGFIDEVPEGWRQLSPLVRVAELDLDGGPALYPTPRE